MARSNSTYLVDMEYCALFKRLPRASAAHCFTFVRAKIEDCLPIFGAFFVSKFRNRGFDGAVTVDRWTFMFLPTGTSQSGAL